MRAVLAREDLRREEHDGVDACERLEELEPHAEQHAVAHRVGLLQQLRPSPLPRTCNMCNTCNGCSKCNRCDECNRCNRCNRCPQCPQVQLVPADQPVPATACGRAAEVAGGGLTGLASVIWLLGHGGRMSLGRWQAVLVLKPVGGVDVGYCSHVR